MYISRIDCKRVPNALE